MEKDLKIPDTTGLTFEKVWLMMQKTDEQMQKTDEQMQKTDNRLNKSIEETKALKQMLFGLGDDSEKLKQMLFGLGDDSKKLKQMLFGLGNNLGQITEDYFYNSVSTDKTVDGIKYDYIDRNVKREGKKLNGEYDIVLINSSRLLVIEVKQKPHTKDIEKFITKQLPTFKKLFPMYANYKIYGAIAGMTFSTDAKEFAKENGLYILTQNQDSKNMQMLNDEGFKAKEF